MTTSLAAPPAADAPVLERHEVTITYLEQTSALHNQSLAQPGGGKTALMRLKTPPLPFYRYLFDAVGKPHRWISRRYLDDEALAARVHAASTELFCVYKDGWPAGFAEFYVERPKAVHIKFFGLVPEAQGLGLGAWFFRETQRLAWAFDPQRVLIETCTLDSPRALQLYQREGFTVYNQGTGVVEWRG